MATSAKERFALCLVTLLLAGSLFMRGSATAGRPELAGIQSETLGVPLDTTWEGWPDVPKVYNTAKAGATGRTVPMVALDTSAYEKKFWLSDKQPLSEPVKSVYPKVAARNNVAYIVYSTFPDPRGLVYIPNVL